MNDVRGFTLVELILGMAITAIIGLCVYNMFWSGVKLDDKMRHVHDNYMEVLMADQAMTHDLENAINLDFSGSYPDAVVFDGQKTEFSCLTQTSKGIKKVRYFSGLKDGLAEKSMIGRVVNPSSSSNGSKEPLPVEFLIRQESSMGDWLNETTDNTTTQIVAAGFEKGSFNCQYAAFDKDLHNSGEKAIDYKETWDSKGLPMSVSCSFVLYDAKNSKTGTMFKRDMFLAPLTNTK